MLNLVTIVSAEELKKGAEPIAEIRRLENELRTEQRKKEEDKRFADLVQRYADILQREANNGSFWYSEEIYENNLNWKGLKSRLGEFKQIFEQANYDVHIHYYSHSWTCKSGKYAYLSITWHNS